MKILLILLASFFANAQNQLPTVDYVQIHRYVGSWFAISALPQFFTRKCLYQGAEYKVVNESKISLVNTCYKKKGKIKTIEGQAVVVNKKTNAELMISFNNFWTKLFKVRGDYNIIALDSNYESVLVGSNDRKSMWILSRKKSLSKKAYNTYVEKAEKLGFPVDKLIRSNFNI